LITLNRIDLMQFHTLTLAAVLPETAHAVRLRLAVPADLRSAFAFTAGQFLTLRARVGGVGDADAVDLRRSYSICSTPAQLAAQGTVDVGVKAVAGGEFSPFLQTLRAGDTLQVLPPEGRFVLPKRSVDASEKAAEHSLCIAAGSGITPLLAMMGERLASDPQARFTLLYGNRNTASALFLEDLYALKNRYRERLDMHLVMSRQHSDIALHNGRLDAAKLMSFLNGPLKGIAFVQALVCGPNDLIDICEGMLPSMGIATVRSERFGTAPALNSGTAYALGSGTAGMAEPLAQLTIIAGGLEHAVPWTSATPLLLDAGLDAGLDLPYACKGGVCCTCRAKVLSGTVTMDKNYTLEPDEVAAGFVLTCQCRPSSDAVVVSYDER
jgi:ring-1,2-phenylacetyl-CoA epoxidase subunit PaaE